MILFRWIPTGHINEAYYVALYDGKEVRQYMVQKVNWYVFRDPVSMMHNIDFPEHNLRRVQAQLVLFQDVMEHMEDMKRIIRECI